MAWRAREPTLPESGAEIIREHFLDYVAEFRRLTLQARSRFEQRDWVGGRRDAVARLGLYRSAVGSTVAALQRLQGPGLLERSAWRAMKADYALLVAGRADLEVAETFFNSITRRVFATVGVDPDVEFVAPIGAGSGHSAPPVVETFVRHGSIRELVLEILRRYRFGVGYADVERDAAAVTREIERYTPRVGVRAVELAKPVFYRNKGAYLVGCIRSDAGTLPLVIALLNVEGQVTVDAVLLAENEVSIVFSFTRSYFLVSVEHPGALVRFLQTIMPHKPVDELYNSIGYNKHGKTELYRMVLRHLESTEECFQFARGARGTVMIVFTMPSLDIVFKVIRDRFLPPKTTTRREVMEKYQLVFQHDRAGRLVDAQEFEHLKFERRRFAPALLDELQSQAHDVVEVDGASVVIHHLYTERRLVPLDLYLREAAPLDARAAMLDYGQALRDLAATNIFPGDLLLKNFGVTRNHRLVFYDYDELCLLTDCNFRTMPSPPGPEEELAGEPWFYAGERDIFPQEFIHFLEFRGALRADFLAAHGDLLRVGFWKDMQQAHELRLMMDVFPYPQERRLQHPPGVR